LRLFFYDFEHTFHVSAPALVPFESNDLASMICVQPNGSARFHFINLVGRCPPDISPVTFDHLVNACSTGDRLESP